VLTDTVVGAHSNSQFKEPSPSTDMRRSTTSHSLSRQWRGNACHSVSSLWESERADVPFASLALRAATRDEPQDRLGDGAWDPVGGPDRFREGGFGAVGALPVGSSWLQTLQVFYLRAGCTTIALHKTASGKTVTSGLGRACGDGAVEIP